MNPVTVATLALGLGLDLGFICYFDYNLGFISYFYYFCYIYGSHTATLTTRRSIEPCDRCYFGLLLLLLLLH